MKTFKKWLSCLLVCVLLLCLEAGCNSEDSQKKDIASDNTITIGVAQDIGDLNPHLYNSKMFAQNLVYEGLVTYKNNKIEPSLAETWEVNEDGTEIVFHLRKGVKFSDGSEFNSAIAIKNIDAVMANKERHSWLSLIDHIVSYEAIDDYTLKFVLDETYYPALQEFSHIRPLRMLAEAGFPESGKTDESIAEPIGTGPWVLKEHVDGEYAVFVRNEYYWGDKPKLDGFTLRFIPDSDTAVTSLEAGEIDMIYDFYGSTCMTIDSFNYLAKEGFQTTISDPVMTRILIMNTKDEVLSDIRVRQALIYGLDRQTLVNNVFQGAEGIAQSLFSDNMPYCDINYNTVYNFDQAKAISLLEDAGWILPEGKEFRVKDGKVLSLTYHFNGQDPIKRNMGQIMQSQYAKLGIELKLVGEEEKMANSRRESGDYDILDYTSWGMPYDPHSTLNSLDPEISSVFSVARRGIKNSEVEYELLKNAIKEADEVKRQEIFTELLNNLQDEAWYIPISNLTNRAAYTSDIHNVEFNIAYDILLNNTYRE